MGCGVSAEGPVLRRKQRASIAPPSSFRSCIPSTGHGHGSTASPVHPPHDPAVDDSKDSCWDGETRVPSQTENNRPSSEPAVAVEECQTIQVMVLTSPKLAVQDMSTSLLRVSRSSSRTSSVTFLSSAVPAVSEGESRQSPWLLTSPCAVPEASWQPQQLPASCDNDVITSPNASNSRDGRDSTAIIIPLSLSGASCESRGMRKARRSSTLPKAKLIIE